jgi:hypothetical protein
VLRLVTLAALAALAGALAASVSAAPPPSVIRLVSTTTSASHADVKPKGPSARDRDTSTSRLVNQLAQFGKPKGAIVGSDRGTVTYTGAHSATLRAVTRLPGGTLIVRGPVRPIGNGAVVIAVVGGTGAFAGAHGTLTILPPTSATTAVNVYRLTYAEVV